MKTKTKKVLKNLVFTMAFTLAMIVASQLFNCTNISVQASSSECEHYFDVWITSYEATCVRTGLKSRSCLLCGEVETQIIEMSEHNYSTWQVVTQVTCETDGLQTHYCWNCFYTETEVVEATGHNYESFYTIDISPTYLYEGTQSNHCANANCTSCINSTVAPVLEVETTSRVYTDQATSYTISLSWEPVTYATTYIVYQYISSSWIRVAEIDGNITSATIQNLSASTDYKFKVKALVVEEGTNIYGSATDTHNVRTAPAQTVITSDSQTTTAIRINWNSVSTADGYKVIMYQNEEVLQTEYVDSDTLTYRFADLYTCNEYRFEVYAYEQDGDEILYSDCNDTYYAITDARALQMQEYTNTDSTITLNWQTEQGATGYRVYWNLGSGYSTIITLEGEDISSYTVTGLDIGTTYLFRVKAYFTASTGTVWALSCDTFYATTTLAKVQLTTFTNTTTAIRINWLEVQGATGYVVYYNNSGQWAVLDIVSADTLTYRISGLETNSVYSYSVQAYSDSTGQTVWGEQSNQYVAFTD